MAFQSRRSAKQVTHLLVLETIRERDRVFPLDQRAAFSNQLLILHRLAVRMGWDNSAALIRKSLPGVF